jgi:protein-tyrosine-phosphatase
MVLISMLLAADVVFVCEHGAVKSVMAAHVFNTLAAERGSALRATARGITPDAAAAAPITDRMQAEGIDLGGFRPQPLTPSDAAAARRIILFGDIAPGLKNAEVWDGVPPATEDYEAARDAIRARVKALLDALAPPRPPAGP